MNLYESIKSNLKESVTIDVSKLDSDILERINDGATVTLYHCDDCDSYMTPEELGSKNINMEVYYGVASDFPDSHYQSISVCPKCHDSNLEEVKVDLDKVISDYVDTHYEEVYKAFEERYPEYITSDTYLEDYYDLVFDMVRDKLFS